jgi:hypothetical protein
MYQRYTIRKTFLSSFTSPQVSVLILSFHQQLKFFNYYYGQRRIQCKRQPVLEHPLGSLKNKDHTVKNKFSFDPNILFIWTGHHYQSFLISPIIPWSVIFFGTKLSLHPRIFFFKLSNQISGRFFHKLFERGCTFFWRVFYQNYAQLLFQSSFIIYFWILKIFFCTILKTF